MTIGPSEALTTAVAIGNHLVRTAYRHDGRCTWMGTIQDGEDNSDDLEFTHVTLGPDLYGGTSGVALFLSELAVRVGDPDFRTIAIEGINHAFDHADELQGENELGLYVGQLGVAYAGARVGLALQVDEIVGRSWKLLQQVTRRRGRNGLFDVTAGIGGTISGLLTLTDLLARPELADLAVELGHELLSSATQGHAGWCWHLGERGERPLTGFAHGSAGIGWSLVELYRHTSEVPFLGAAIEAFRYENQWFRPEEDNWPDLRAYEEGGDPAPCMVAWCHGAPGIGLARIAARAMIADPSVERDLIAACRSSRLWLQQLDPGDRTDFCLCHGIAGVAEFLWRAADAVQDMTLRDVVGEVAGAGRDRYGNDPDQWPCGIKRGSNPSLMIGFAGIGYFYLQLAHPELPSVLTLAPPAS